MKFGFDWPSGFGKWGTDGRRQTDDGACLNYKLTNEPKGSGELKNQQNDLCAQRRLRSAWASAQSHQSSLCTQWVAMDPSFLHVDSEDFDQAGRMPRLI